MEIRFLAFLRATPSHLISPSDSVRTFLFTQEIEQKVREAASNQDLSLCIHTKNRHKKTEFVILNKAIVQVTSLSHYTTDNLHPAVGLYHGLKFLESESASPPRDSIEQLNNSKGYIKFSSLHAFTCRWYPHDGHSATAIFDLS
jgi:hypothetical protein